MTLSPLGFRQHFWPEMQHAWSEIRQTVGRIQREQGVGRMRIDQIGKLVGGVALVGASAVAGNAAWNALRRDDRQRDIDSDVAKLQKIDDAGDAVRAATAGYDPDVMPFQEFSMKAIAANTRFREATADVSSFDKIMDLKLSKYGTDHFWNPGDYAGTGAPFGVLLGAGGALAGTILISGIFPKFRPTGPTQTATLAVGSLALAALAGVSYSSAHARNTHVDAIDNVINYTLPYPHIQDS